MPRGALVRWGCALIFACLFVSLLGHDAYSTFRIAHADFVTEHIDELRRMAVTSDVVAATDHLQEIIDFYPSGSVQRQGSALDRVVERVRARAIAEIIDHLRRKSGKDFGDDPQKWIREIRGDSAEAPGT